MRSALDLVKALIDDGVTFETDGERIRWRNAEGRIDGAVIDQLRRGKAEIIDFLRGDRSRKKAAQLARRAIARSQSKPATIDRPDDIERYAEALQLHGPCGYGPIAFVLGWGGSRAGRAEDALRKSGRITYDGAGRGMLIEKGKWNDQ